VDNDERVCALSNPTLSSVAVSLENMAEQVGRFLENYFQTGRMPYRTARVRPAGVVERNSTAIVLAQDPRVAEAMSILRRRAYEPINIKELFSELSHSRRQFDRYFKDIVGRTPFDELCRLRVDRAINLLRETRRSVTDIAALCGFSSTTHMRRVFLLVAERSPQSYRP
ncbi:MAG: helix-turn-helix domain-containing protein, partial [Kiritimatiellia bacterium]|nr:helix-turn-helix domain-containing protein [Kiritimatiellia bacterium]